MNLEQIVAFEKRRIAYHEAGHAIVAWKLGATVQRVQISSAPVVIAGVETVSWGGWSFYRRDPGSESIAQFTGWGGLVAEGILQDEWDGDSWQDLDPEDFSPTDLESIESGTDWEIAAARTHGILVENWRHVVAVAEELIAGEIVTDWIFEQIIVGKWDPADPFDIVKEGGR